MVVVEITTSQLGRRRAISRTKGRSSKTSPTLTAWNQRQGWSPIRKGAFPAELLAPTVAVLAGAKPSVQEQGREDHQGGGVDHIRARMASRGILSRNVAPSLTPRDACRFQQLPCLTRDRACSRGRVRRIVLARIQPLPPVPLARIHRRPGWPPKSCSER